MPQNARHARHKLMHEMLSIKKYYDSSVHKMNKLNKRKIFSTKVSVLVNHLNYANHLGYDSLLSILQEARLRWLKTVKHGISEINIENGIGWLVKDVHVIYEAEALHGDELLIELFVSETKKTSFTLEYIVINQTSEKQVCHATTNLVCFNFEGSKVARIPSVLSDYLFPT